MVGNSGQLSPRGRRAGRREGRGSRLVNAYRDDDAAADARTIAVQRQLAIILCAIAELASENRVGALQNRADYLKKTN